MFKQYIGDCMQTGIQTLDKLIEKIGLRTHPCDNDLQQVDLCYGGVQPQLVDTKLPFCIARAIFRAPMYSTLRLHQLWLAGRSKPLACFLVDENGDIVERVYYQNGRKYYDACDKVIRHIQRIDSHSNRQAA